MSANINRSNIAINSVELKGLIDKTLEYRERGHNQHAKFYAHLTMQVARVIDNWAKEPMQVGQWRA